MSSLGNVDPGTFWAHHTWSDFASLAGKARALAVLPIHGFADHGLGLPLDAEEIVGAEILRRAVMPSSVPITVRVLPALRFALAPISASFFGVDPDTAHALIREIAEGVRDAGFKKLVLVCTSPWNEELVDVGSRDIRVALGLQTFVINLNGLDLDFHPASPSRGRVQAAAAHLMGTPPKPSKRAADVIDADFRPGNWRQPGPVAFDPKLDGEAILAEASARLARLFAEIDAKVPLSQSDEAGKSDSEEAAAPAGAPHLPFLWPRYRSRYLSALTRDELEALPHKEGMLVIIPTGAIEQHGRHLPVGVDSILGQALLDAALAKLSPGTHVWVAPPITYGKSNEHVGFPGTVSVSAQTFRRLLLAQAVQLKSLGFRVMGVLNTHGGNSATVVYTLREIQATLGLRAGMIAHGYKPAISDQEREYGFHAGEWETSLMLAIAENLVRMDRAESEYPARLDDAGELRPENAPAIFSWISSDISRSGTIGDPTLATAEKGRRWLEEASTALARRITALAG